MDFVRDGNIRRFKEMLARETDPVRRQTIKELLREERWRANLEYRAQVDRSGDDFRESTKGSGCSSS